MKSIEIQGQKRTEIGKKSSKKLRASGFVPCELYGGTENVHFSVEEKMLNKIIYTPNVYVVELNIDGKKHNAVLKEAQYHPVSDSALHVDFVEIFDDKKAAVKIPVKISGNSVGIRNGGKLRLAKRALYIIGFPKDLPDTLDIDITKLDIGDSIKVKDLNFENLEIKDPSSSMVVGIVSSRISKSMSGEEESEEGAEGESEGESATEEEKADE